MGSPTYRGHGGIWKEYNYEDYACQRAFDRDPDKVWDFHDKRRAAVAACEPSAGHRMINLEDTPVSGLYPSAARQGERDARCDDVAVRAQRLHIAISIQNYAVTDFCAQKSRDVIPG